MADERIVPGFEKRELDEPALRRRQGERLGAARPRAAARTWGVIALAEDCIELAAHDVERAGYVGADIHDPDAHPVADMRDERTCNYPAPNVCWQLDGTEYVLTGGRKCVIYQLIDDHARLAVASHVAWGEEAAIAVVKKGIAAHGVPQRLLSDNGAALRGSGR